MPGIVVLDGYTMNPGDLDWTELEALGDLTVYDRTPAAQTVSRAEGAELVLTNKVVLGEREMAALPALRYIGVLATGYNVVDLAAARAHGVTVTHVPAYSTASVAQIVFAHLLNLAQGIAVHSASVRRGEWTRSPDFAYWKTPLVELEGKTLGIVGFGRIGRAVAALAQAFGMQVQVHTRTPGTSSCGVTFTDLDTLLSKADAVTLHCPLTAETESLIDANRLRRMKPTAWLINTGRGPLVDEQAVADALREKRLAGFAADVLSTEPPRPDNPLPRAPRTFITPHVAWASRDARIRLYRTVVENARAFLAGHPVNVVSNGSA